MRTRPMLLVVAALFAVSAHGQTLESKVFEGPGDASFTRYQWADFNADGEFDILNVDPYGRATVFISDGGAFSPINLEFQDLYFAEDRCAFNDYDGDGDIDILASLRNSIVIVNYDEDNGFTLVSTGIDFTDPEYGKLFWLDLDGDLVLDIIHGRKVFINHDGTYSESQVLLPELLSNMVLDDINGDGLADIVAGGYESYDGTDVSIFLNEGGGLFKQSGAPILPVGKIRSNTIALLDADADSDIDVFAIDLFARGFIFRNSLAQTGQTSFAATQIFSNISLSMAIAGDLNSDGLQDLVFYGQNLTALINTSAGTNISFAQETYDLQLDLFENFELVDINDDRKPDIHVKGYSYQNGTENLIFENVSTLTGAAPSAPVNISSIVEGNAKLSWSAVPGLLYNIELKRNGAIYRSSATSSSGRLLVPTGSFLLRHGSLMLRGLSAGSYEWRVQALDPSGRSSAFSMENAFQIKDGPTSLTLLATDLTHVELCWTYSGIDNPSFAIFRGTSSTPAVEIARVGPGTTCYEDNAVPDNKRVEYFVIAVDGAEFSAASNTVIHHSTMFVESRFGITDPNIVAARCFSADFDMDGDYDLEFIGRIGTSFNNNFLFKNDGSGSFTTHGSMLPASAIQIPDIQATGPRDIDNDGDPDLVVITGEYYSWQKVSVFINDNGTFTIGFQTPEYLNIPQLVVEDMNSDGRPDLMFSHAIGNSSNNPQKYELLYQTMEGGFEDSHIKFTNVESSALAMFKCVDLNSDGFLDILWASPEKERTEILVNEAGSGFTRKTSILPVTYAMGVADYTGDGIVDVMVQGNEGMNLYFGAGDFIFTEPKVIPVGYRSGGPTFIHADIDLNGWPDLLLSDDYNVEVVLNKGNGSFKTSDIELKEDRGTTIEITDFENDGDIDLVKLGNDGQHQGLNYLYENQLADINVANAPPATPAGLSANYESGKAVFSWSAATDDKTPSKLLTYNLWVIDSDGKVWLGPETDASGTFRRRMAPGNTGYSIVKALNDLPVGVYTARVQAIDASFALSAWSEDIHLTILEGPNALAIERILLNKVNLTWTGSPFAETKVVVQRRTVETAWQGIADLPAGSITYTDANLGYNKLYQYRVFEATDLASTTTSNVAEWSTNMWVMQDTDIANLYGYMDVADFTGDGRMDMLINGGMIYNGYTEDITRATFENTGNGWIKNDIAPSGLTHTAQIAFADLNGDHKPDVYQHGMNSSFVYKTEVFQNNGDKTFSPAANPFTNGTYAIQSYWDFDMDNDLDVSVTKAGSYPVVKEVYRNNGGGNYSAVNAMTCTGCSQDVVVADFDRDGDEDVIRNVGGSYQLHLSTPAGLLATGVSFSAYSTMIAATDFNSDRLPDLILLSSSYGSGGKIYKNLGVQDNGTIRFAELPINLSSGNPSLLSGDFDHDGNTDLVILSPTVSVLMNNGDDTFDPYAEPEFRLSLHIGGVIDFDDDGDLDIYVSGYHVKESSEHGRKAKILLNQTVVSAKGITNSPPEPPHDLVATQDSLGVHLSWSAANDDHTTSGGITYDVVLFRDGKAITKGHHDPVSGRRLRLSQGRSTGMATLNNLRAGQYSWRVQAIDGSFAASTFSEEGTFTFLPPPPGINDTVIYKCGRPVTLTAKGTGIKWFRDKGLTQLLASGEFHPEETQTVYVVQTVDGYDGIPRRVRITIHDKPPVPEFAGANPLIICGAGVQWLWVMGENVRWYSDQALTDLLSSSNDLQVPPSNATYYVTQGVPGCASDALAVQVQKATIDPRIYATDDRIWTTAKDGDQFHWFRNGWYHLSTTVPYIPFDGQTATYVVLVVKGQCQEYSDPFISSADNITAVEEKSDSSLAVFPNPASSQITISSKLTSAAINIYDTMGKLIYSSSVEPGREQMIDTSQWPKGVYVIVWDDEKMVHAKRLILN